MGYKYKDDETLQVIINASTAIQDRKEQVTVEALVRQMILDHANPMPDYDEIEMYLEIRKQHIAYLGSG